MKLYLGTDHAGFALKEKIKEWLKEWEYDFEDLGAKSFDPTDDYVDFVRPVAKAVAHEPLNSLGIILGASGQGEAIVANRYLGVRAVVYYGGNIDIIRLSREHNDSNILALGARFVSEEEARTAIKLWLELPFSGEERHERRIEKIDHM